MNFDDNTICQINYYKTLKYVIDLSGLSIKDFAKLANISESLIRHADETWNPKYTTVEKICSVVHISIPSFYKISEYLAGKSSVLELNYIIEKQSIPPNKLCTILKKTRIKKHITEGKLAAKTGFNKANISKRENKKWVSNMLCSTLEIYAHCFGISMKQLAKLIYNS